ncbi:MAG: DUF6879 family protein [Candidatus Microsaccharimonas sp.]
MKTLPRQEANIKWDTLWSDMKSEWFKLEVLQDYSAEEGESLKAWMAGDKKRSVKLLTSESLEWLDDCRQKVESGVKLIRIHIVDYPLSEYIKWEIEAYKHRNIPLGKEDVYLLNRKDISSLNLPDGDLMIFDKTNAVIGHYDESGYAVSQTFYDENDDISEFLELRAALLKSNLVKVT